MEIKFTPTQRNIISVAKQRQDRCLRPLITLKGIASNIFAQKLIDAGLAREKKAKNNIPVGRRDKESDQNYALKLTASGTKIDVDQSNGPNQLPNSMTANTSKSPRESTKLKKLIELLSREDGGTNEYISRTMNWLPHTTRAALSRLRKRGFIIECVRDDKPFSIYRIVSQQTV